MVEHYFIINEVFEIFFTEGILFEVEVVCTYRLSCWLIIWEMECLEVWMFKGLLYCDSILWIICKHLFNQVNGRGVSSFEELFKILSFPLG